VSGDLLIACVVEELALAIDQRPLSAIAFFDISRDHRLLVEPQFLSLLAQ
jgi:hypothetical protein